MKYFLKLLLPTSGSKLRPPMTREAKWFRLILFFVLLCPMLRYAFFVKDSPFMALVIFLGFAIAFVISFNKGYFPFGKEQ